MRRLSGLAAVATAFLTWGVMSAARAQDETTHDDATSDDADIEAGELGSLEDDVPVPRRQAVSPPRVVVDPSVRAALAHRFSPDFSAEIYVRGQLGALASPLVTRSSTFAGGLILNRRIDRFIWTNSLELSQDRRDFYDRFSYDAYEATTAFADPLKLTSALTLTPRVSLGYIGATESRHNRIKTEIMAPLAYKVSKQFELTMTPRFNFQYYDTRPDRRRDNTGQIAGGFKYDLFDGMSLAASVGYETRLSSVSQFNHVRWKLAPQINFRKEL